MQFRLQFYQPTEVTLTPPADQKERQLLFPYTATYRYKNGLLDAYRFRYDRRSVQLDYFSVRHAEDYTFDVITDSRAYVLIALEQAKLTSQPPHMTTNVLSLSSNECLLLFVEAGRYSMKLGGTHSRFHMITLDPAILYLLRDEFDELVAFMETTGKKPLSSMASCVMDDTFRHRLRRLTDAPFSRYKDFNRHLLWELPSLLSAYKGLLHGKDRHTQEQRLVAHICRHIEEQLKARRRVSVASLCRDFPVSRRKLERLFSAFQHSSPSSYIRRRKMDMIGALLRSTDLSVLELALLFGYSDSQSLHKAFKREMGISPAQYRRQ